MVKLENLEVYKLAMEVGEKIWVMVLTWDYFCKDTLGKQMVRSADSISSNISEGYGRFSYKENKQFCYYSRGSLMETKTWITKAMNRKLIAEEDFQTLFTNLELIHKKYNGYIKSIGSKNEPMTSD